MAWHILHGLLEQVRVHSTFPGKLWIIVMFIFRIVVVARIGDNVYHDEQSSFICNTLTPGCANVCFNKFSPISQLRFWSLMILVVSTPSILFFIYTSHKIYHATVKFPLNEEVDDATESIVSKTDSIPTVPPYFNPPKLKRKRTDDSCPLNATAPPLYTVKQISSHSYENTNSLWSKNRTHLRNRRNRLYAATNIKLGNDFANKFNSSTTENNYTPHEDEISPWNQYSKPNGFPIYEDNAGRKIEFIKTEKPPKSEAKLNKETKEMLKHPQIYRVYWWHVLVRTALEYSAEACNEFAEPISASLRLTNLLTKKYPKGGFLYLQYFLYGFFVPELFECRRLPCPRVTDCFVSRPMEKTCLLWLMYGLGGISCLLSLGEFWSLGWDRFKYAFCCRGHKMTYEEKRIRLAQVEKYHRKHPVQQHHRSAPAFDNSAKDEVLLVQAGKGFTSELSLDSFSSETTVESV